ncbi:MAG: peptide synthetase [Polyangiaceae bacterium]|nr:peptide synthetase [Polyangiaceae bacterium]
MCAGERVALLLDRSLDAIVAMLAVLKAGAAYVPIDTAAPKPRRASILARISAALLITSSEYMLDVDGHDGGIFVTDLQSATLPQSPPEPPAVSTRAAELLAYIIFTSGTSGEPKGVMVSHRGIVRLVRQTNYIQLDADERLLLTGSLSFDASTFEIWGMLLNGGTLYVESQATLLDSALLARAVARHRITTMWFTSAWFTQLVDQSIAIFEPLACIFTGGDVISKPHVERLRRHHPDLRIVHVYGPTENTTYSLFHDIEGEYPFGIPIGRPIGNSTAFIVDDRFGLLPAYAWGEIVVGGDGLGIGYWKDEPETQAKFVEVSLPGAGQVRLYRSGDIGRVLPNGQIEFGGRADGQVKIRGFRVESREVEQVVMQQLGVQDVRVVVRGEGSDKSLCAYVVATESCDKQGLRATLKQLLPDYMVPRHVVFLDAFPLNINGKLDLRRLPEPAGEDQPTNEAPITPTESYLQEVWAELLSLERGQIGRRADFFDLGGHSLKATLLISRVHRDLGAVLTLNDVFDGPVLTDLARCIDALGRHVYAPIQAIESRRSYACSSQQTRMFMLQQLEPIGTAYNVPMVFDWSGPLDVQRLERAFETLLTRHEALRTSFELEAGRVHQIVHPTGSLRVERAKDSVSATDELVRQRVAPFDLGQSPLMRVFVVERSAASHLLLVDAHHVILDAFSIEVLLRELGDAYQGRPLPPLQLQYRDYAEWQRSPAWEAAVAESRAYWLSQFATMPTPASLPTVKRRPPVQTFQGRTFHLSIESTTLTRLKRVSQDAGATLFMTLLSCVYVWLNKLTGGRDLVVGTPIAGRIQPEIERVVGLFVNTLALRCELAPTDTWLDLLRRTKRLTVDAYKHQIYPFERLVEEVVVRRDSSRNPLFDVMFALQNADTGALEIEGTRIEPYYFDTRTAKFDVNIWGGEVDGRLDLAFEFNTELFSESRARELADCLEQAISAFGSAPADLLSHVSLLSEAKLQELSGRAGAASPMLGGALSQRVELHATERPERLAVYYGSRALTYAALNARANQLASVLRRLGCGPDRVIALQLKRSVELIAAIVAVHKAQGAFLIIDPGLPLDRRQLMVADCQATLVVTAEEATEVGGVQALWLNDPRVEQASTENLDLTIDETSLAYLIYTSGSTGKPKGAQLTHRSLANLVLGLSQTYASGFSAKDGGLSITNTSFDAFIAETSLPLWFGASLSLVEEDDLLDPVAIASMLLAHEITFAYLPLVLLAPIAGSLRRTGKRLPLNKLMIGAEPINDAMLTEWLALNPDLHVLNAYGPTEATVCVSLYDCRERPPTGELLPIGKPMPNVRLFLVDDEHQLVPDGAVGQILIGGASVGRGYTASELTAERFCRPSFEPDGWFYQSGDLARWDHTGNLVFLGRKDDQVKLRGVRIEPAEIEAAIGARSGIREVVVQVKTLPHDETPRLVAYYFGAAPIPDVELRAWCRQRLPPFMIPELFVHLVEPPLLVSGKIDRQCLPLPPAPLLTADVPPRDATELKIAQQWAHVLKVPVERIGVCTSFFDMGGNSLKLIELVGRLRAELSATIRPIDLFSAPTVQDLARVLRSAGSAEGQTVEDFSL